MATDDDKTAEPEQGQNPPSEEPTQTATDAAQPSTDYKQLMDMMSQMQANQDKMAAQIERISDAQSMLVGAGAVIHESPASDTVTDVENANDDGYVPIEMLDLSI